MSSIIVHLEVVMQAFRGLLSQDTVIMQVEGAMGLVARAHDHCVAFSAALEDPIAWVPLHLDDPICRPAALPLFVDRSAGLSHACTIQRHDLFLVDRVATPFFKMPSAESLELA